MLKQRTRDNRENRPRGSAHLWGKIRQPYREHLHGRDVRGVSKRGKQREVIPDQEIPDLTEEQISGRKKVDAAVGRLQQEGKVAKDPI